SLRLYYLNMVPEGGLEPQLLSEEDFKSTALSFDHTFIIISLVRVLSLSRLRLNSLKDNNQKNSTRGIPCAAKKAKIKTTI
ncbi:hypothetical protein, partial [Aliivibrio sp.]|uniref:hypothetical protein n=1 Tax=Aliivibrio sp. TaxID=1872443 RepID=UPI003D2EDE4B